MAVIKSFLAFCFVMFIFYLIGSFCAASFDIRNWDSTGRGVCGAFGGIFGLVCASFIYDKEG